MARPLRIQYADACYHVTSRGNERKAIYLNDRDRIRFLDMLGKAVEDYELVLHAHILMVNHYHLEVQTPLANLSEAMQWLNASYAGYFNAVHVRRGHLFQGRFHSVLVDKDAYLKELTRYIHLNSVRAGLVTRPENYRWSSYRAYLGLEKQPKWLEIEWTLGQFAETVGQARRAYRQFVEDGMPGRVHSPLDEATGGAVLGREEFVEAVRERIVDLPDRGDLPALRSLKERVSIERITALVSRETGTEDAMLLPKGKHSNQARRIAIYLSRKHSGEKLSQIARRFGGVTQASISAVSRELERSLRTDASLREKVRLLEEKLNLKL